MHKIVTGVPEPLSFTKIAFDHRIYELSWRPPSESDRIHSYTIFWCENKMDRPYQCTVCFSINLNIRIYTVSYTHLDVYKRQALASFAARLSR